MLATSIMRDATDDIVSTHCEDVNVETLGQVRLVGGWVGVGVGVGVGVVEWRGAYLVGPGSKISQLKLNLFAHRC